MLCTELALENDFDILSISETWFNSSVTNRIGKTGAGVCAYIKSALKVTVLKDLTGITESGLHK